MSFSEKGKLSLPSRWHHWTVKVRFRSPMPQSLQFFIGVCLTRCQQQCPPVTDHPIFRARVDRKAGSVQCYKSYVTKSKLSPPPWHLFEAIRFFFLNWLYFSKSSGYNCTSYPTVGKLLDVCFSMRYLWFQKLT